MTPVEEAIAALEVFAHRAENPNAVLHDDDYIRAAQAFSRLRAEGEGWRPISEHDGSATPVDLWMSLGWRVTNAYWAEYDDDEGVGHTWLTEDGGWIEGEDCRATHFRPPPDPPRS